MSLQAPLARFLVEGIDQIRFILFQEHEIFWNRRGLDGLTTDKIFDHLRENYKAEIELLRSLKGNNQKQNKNATEAKFEPENRPSTPLPSIQRVLNDDVEKWRAEKDYERLRQKIAREHAQESCKPLVLLFFFIHGIMAMR